MDWSFFELTFFLKSKKKKKKKETEASLSYTHLMDSHKHNVCVNPGVLTLFLNYKTTSEFCFETMVVNKKKNKTKQELNQLYVKSHELVFILVPIDVAVTS